MENKHYVYILQCKDDTLYTGYTNHVKERLEKHESGKGAKYTRGRGPFKLLYTEEYESKGMALKREHEIKKLTRAQKISLIDSKLKEDVHENTEKL